jgi:hypothetical protein
MRRREFLIVSSMSAAAVSITSRAQAAMGSPAGTVTGAAVGSPPALASAGARSLIDVHAIVYDSRYPIARELAQRRVEQGAQAFSTGECMVSLWRGTLAECIERGETRIAGFTTYSDFTIARECARDHGLRVLEEKWCRDCPGTFVSWLIGH